MQNMSGGKTALGLDANVGALLCYLLNFVCYLGIVYSIVVLVTDKTNRLARFHAAQSLILSAIGIVLFVPGYLIAVGLALSGSSMLALLSTLIWLVLVVGGLALFVFMVISAIKAFQGELYKIPVIGGFAEKFAN